MLNSVWYRLKQTVCAQKCFFGIIVTRFGEISAYLQNILRLWQHLDGYFSIWQNFEPTLGKDNALGQIFIYVNGQMIKSYLDSLMEGIQCILSFKQEILERLDSPQYHLVLFLFKGVLQSSPHRPEEQSDDLPVRDPEHGGRKGDPGRQEEDDAYPSRRAGISIFSKTYFV